MKKALVYSCVLLLLSCGGKTGGTSQSSSTNQETQENALSEKTTAISEAFSMDFYEGSDWIIPDTLSESLLKEPEASSLKVYDSDSICRKQVDGVERCFYKDSLMNGAYKHFYFRSTDSFMSEPYYSVVVYKDGIKNDTVRHYSISSHCMTSRIITLDSICELYQSYYSNGYPHIFYQATRGKLNGVRQRWYYDGKPDWFEHYKDGKLNGEEMRWHANGHLWQVNHYIDDQEVLPTECWYYSHSEYAYNDPDGVAEAPDWYEYKYQASEGTPLYYIQEIYALENGKKYLLKRKYFEKDSDEPIYFMDDKCDSVKRSIVTVGTQKRLDIRNYSGGRLRRFESYPYSEKGVPGVMTEIYSEEGNRIEKSMYDYHSGRMISLRMYSNTGADVKKLEFAEYTNMKADSCNKQLDSGKGRYTDNQNKLSVRWKKGELALLNSPAKEDEDGFIKWYYDGYQSDYGLHFFHYSGFESWGYFVMSDVTGEVYEYRSIDTPLFCGKSGLFLVVDENPYKEECYVRVYKMLPEGRLAEVAALNRGGGDYFEVDLDDFVWVGESSFIANKKTSEDELQCDFYGGCSDSCLEEYRKCGYLQIDEDGWGYVRVDLRPDALQTKQELPSSLEAINEMNAWVKSL